MNIKFSIIIPTLNSEKTLTRCISSVIKQTYKNWEIIVVDASKNKLCQNICNKFNLGNKLVYKKSYKKKGLAFDRYLGIRQAKGNYISFLDSDDIWLKNKLKNQYINIVKNNSKFICSNYILRINKTKFYSSLNIKFFDFNFLLKNRPISNSAATVEKKLILKVSSQFNKNIMAEDFLWWSLILKKYYAKCYVVKNHDVINLYSQNSRTKNFFENHLKLYSIYRNYLIISFIFTIYCFIFLIFTTFKKNILKLSLYR